MADSLAAPEAQGVMGEMLRKVDQELVEGKNRSCEDRLLTDVWFQGQKK